MGSRRGIDAGRPGPGPGRKLDGKGYADHPRVLWKPELDTNL